MTSYQERMHDEWFTGCRPELSDPTDKYIIMIRGPDDPERSSRKERQKRGERHDWYRSLNKKPVGEWKLLLLANLADGIPKTFNRICVEIMDKTADMVAGYNPEEALWNLCGDGKVEFTGHAPTLFRITC